jgi:DNA-binding SARP family transcriptional activator
MDHCSRAAGAAALTTSSCHERLKCSSEAAVEMIQRYAAMDPMDENSPWQNPQDIFEQLQQARSDIQTAWKDFQDAVATEQSKTEKNACAKSLSEDEFRILYMDMITDAFGDVLEEMRLQAGDKMDVDVLVDCLQSGMEFLEENERNSTSYFDSMTELPEEDEDDNSSIPIHQRMQEFLGLHPAESKASER